MQTGAELTIRADKARDGGGDTNPGEGQKRLVFKVGEFSLALEITALRRVHDAEGLPPRTAGTRVIDLHHLAGARSDRPVSYWLELEVDENKYLMPVELVEGIGELAVAVALPYPRVMRSPRMKFIRRLLFDGMRMIVDLDPRAMAESAGGPQMPLRRNQDPDSGSGRAKGAAALSDQLLVFETYGRELMVDMGLVVSIISLDYVFEVPRAGKPIRGVVYHADQAVPVVSPRDLLDRDRADKPAEAAGMAVLVETSQGMVGVEADKVARVTGRSAAAGDPEALEIGPELLIDFLA